MTFSRLMGALALLALCRLDLVAQELLFGVEIETRDEILDGLGPHAALEVVAVAVFQLTPDDLVVDDVLDREVLEGVEGAPDHVDVPLGALAHFLLLAFRLVAALPSSRRIEPCGLHLFEAGLELTEDLVDAPVPVRLEATDLVLDIALELWQSLCRLASSTEVTMEAAK